MIEISQDSNSLNNAIIANTYNQVPLVKIDREAHANVSTCNQFIYSDFVFAVFSEEFGFLGILLLLAIYIAIISRGILIAVNDQDTFSRLVAGSLTLTFFFYVFVNIGMVSGILPVVGLPLPLISYGGTSMVTIMAAFGILMSIHTNRKLVGA